VINVPIIRPADAADIEELVALDHAARASSERRAFIGRSISHGACQVGTLDGRPVGYIILEYTFFENGFISLLYVAEGSRRRGIGAALIRHVERTCRTPKLFTSANASNAPMRRLLLGLGFQPSGVVENLDENDPELLFFKRLSEGATVPE
jgi:GNAT superfamily N-acetyltransferase